jgi:CheY-like chemotaxis protein
MSPESIRIFLADDDEDDCFLFQDALREIVIKHELVVARDGVQIMETLREKIPPSPHYLFLDINMPLKNGLECLAEIQKVPAYQPIPVIMFSTSIDEKHIETAKKLGAKHYIQKPQSFSGLKTLLQHVVDVPRGANSTLFSRDFLITSFK